AGPGLRMGTDRADRGADPSRSRGVGGRRQRPRPGADRAERAPSGTDECARDRPRGGAGGSGPGCDLVQSPDPDREAGAARPAAGVDRSAGPGGDRRPGGGAQPRCGSAGPVARRAAAGSFRGQGRQRQGLPGAGGGPAQRSMTPSATSVAGPVSVTSPVSVQPTLRRPPGTSTVQGRPLSSPARRAAATATATTPVPQERVSPTPRS